MKENFQSNTKLPLFTLLLVTTLVFATSCRAKKAAVACGVDNTGVNRDAKNEVFKSIEKNRFEFQYFSASASGTYSDGAGEYGLNLSLRMQKNEKVWMSVSFLFFEVARVLIDKDSVYIIDYANKTATVRSLDYVGKYLGAELNIGQMQDVLVGNSILKHDNNSAMDNSENQLKVTTRIKQFLFEEVFNTGNFRPKTVNTNETGGNNKLDLQYDDYAQVNCRLIPQKLQLSAVTNTQSITASLNYSDISTEAVTNWPFNIPAKYERK